MFLLFFYILYFIFIVLFKSFKLNDSIVDYFLGESGKGNLIFFYLFKLSYHWVITYLWGVPILIYLLIEVLFLLFLLSSYEGCVYSINFQDRLKSWYYIKGFKKEMIDLNNIFYYPFKFMSSCFKFSGNYLEISVKERFYLYLASFFLVLFLLFHCLFLFFFSIPIYLFFKSVFFKLSLVSFSLKFFLFFFINLIYLVIIFFNIFLFVSVICSIFFIICFSSNLYVNYEVDSGVSYESMGDSFIDGYNFCIVTGSQFRVYNNCWYYKGLYWVLG